MQKILTASALWLLMFAAGAQPPSANTDTQTHDGKAALDLPLPVVPEAKYDSQACLDKVCPMGKDKNYISVRTRKMFQKHSVPPKIEALFKKLEEDEKSVAGSPESFADRKIDLNEAANDPILRTVVNMNYLTKFSNSIGLKNGPNGLQLDRAATAKALEANKVAPELREWVLNGAEYLYTPDFINLMAYYQRLSARDLVGKLGKTEKEAISNIARDFAAFKDRVKQTNSSFGTLMGFLGSARQEKLLEKIAKGGQIDEHEFSTLLEAGSLTGSLLRLSEKGSPFREKLQVSLENLEKEIGSREAAIKKFEKMFESSQEKKLAEMAACRANYIAQRELLPDEKGLEKLTERIKKAKVTIKSKLLTRYSEISSTRVGKVIDEFQMYMPSTVAGLDKRFEGKLGEAVENQELGPKLWNALDDKGKDKLISALYAVLLVRGDSFLGKEDNQPKCEGLMVEIFSDAAVNGNGIVLGAATAAMDESDASSTILHELSHIVSNRFRTGMASQESFGIFQKTRECLRELHSEKEAPRLPESLSDDSLKPYQISLTTEEDYADWGAAVAQGEIPNNPWCSYLIPNADGSSWTPHSIHRIPDDTHSSTLFRILAAEKMRGKKIPEPCVAALKADKGDEDIKVCL